MIKGNTSIKCGIVVRRVCYFFSCVISSYFLTTDSFVSVGKISFSLKDVLGRGCEGTVVYK